MSSDYSPALTMLVPDAYVFPGSWGATRRWLILHKTAGFQTAQEVAAYFQAGSDGNDVSVHYVVGLDGTVVQCVREADGAGGNGVLEAGHDAWWSGNPNLVTFSIEHVDPDINNASPVTPAQQAASFALIRSICTRWAIPMRTADSNGGITGHYSIDPQSRAHCPGNYPWDALWAFLKGAAPMPVPQGWKDNGTTLTAPNKHFLVKGFRDHVLTASAWDASDMPLEEEQSVAEVERHASSGAGTRQLTVGRLLIYTASKGVMESAAGQEIKVCYDEIAAQAKQIATLTAELKAAQTPIAPTAINVTSAIAACQSIATSLVIIEKDATTLK